MVKTNKLLVPGAEQALEQFKYEIAQEFGVSLGSNTASRSNGSVGGEVTKTSCRFSSTTITWITL